MLSDGQFYILQVVKRFSNQLLKVAGIYLGP